MDVHAFQTFCLLLSIFSGKSWGQTVYGTIGENVSLYLPESYGKSLHDIRWLHQNKIIASTKKKIKKFVEVFDDGTEMKLYNIKRNDSGEYTAQAYDDQGFFKLNQTFNLVVIDPPVVELISCTPDLSVLLCAVKNACEATYEWRVSIQNQGHLKVSNHTGRHVVLYYSSGNVSCALKIGNFSSPSETYSLSCAEIKWCVSFKVLVMLILLCFIACGISIGVQICRKQRNSTATSERRNATETCLDDGIVYSEVRVGLECK